MGNRLSLSLALAALLLVPAVGLAGQNDRFDGFDRSRLREEIRRGVREARRERYLLRD